MPDYIQDPNNTKKQIPGAKPLNAYDRAVVPSQHSMSRSPHYVIIGSLTADVGFFLGNSASFSSVATTEGGNGKVISSSAQYTNFGAVAAGTTLHINPTAWSGSATDTVTFVYKGGLDGQGRV